MKDLLITPGAAKVLREMIVCCGNSGCFEAIKVLKTVKKNVRFNKVALDKDGNWRMSVFQRLGWFATDENLSILDTSDIASYFGGRLHIEIIERLADHAGLGRYLGRNIGLVTHVLLPLSKDLSYHNGSFELKFTNPIILNPKEEGTPCYHLGTVAHIPLSKKEVAVILAKQLASPPFKRSLAKISGQTIVPPPEYLIALNCTATKAART